MLKVTVDMVPLGDEDARYTIAEMHIINDGTGDFSHGNYIVRKLEDGEIAETGTINDYERLERPVWDLVGLSIGATSSTSRVESQKGLERARSKLIEAKMLLEQAEDDLIVDAVEGYSVVSNCTWDIGLVINRLSVQL